MSRLLLRKSLLNFRMLAVIVISFSILFGSLVSNGYFSLFLEFASTGSDLLSIYTIPFAFSPFVVLAGLFPGLPYAYSYLEERNSGYLKFIQLRIERKRYRLQKIFFTGLSGGLSMLVPVIALFILLDVMSLDTTPENHGPIFEQLIWAPYLYIWGGRLVLVFKAILMFLFGVLWSELSLTVSLIFKNKYVALVLPFLLFELTWILGQGSILSPVLLIRADCSSDTPLIVPYLIFAAYILLFAAINWFLFKRQEKK